MRVERGSLQDAREIAKLYSAAFPKSVGLFFKKKPPEVLLELLELTFSLFFHWGGEALLIKDGAGSIHGYCLYSAKGHTASKRSSGKALRLLGKMLFRISLPELARLLHNQVLMTAFARYNKKTPTQKSEARIVSIAISPDCQGEGLGTLLFSSVLTTLQEHRIGLNVRPGNTAARRLYQAAGFQSVGSTKDLAGEWLIFVRPPKDPAVS